MKIDPEVLETLIAAAGLRGRKAARLRKANDPKSSDSARGHGAATQEATPIEEL